MKNVNLLDCTLRDGGYINDWNFGHSVMLSTYKRLDDAGVDYIEVGFLDDRRDFDINRSIQPNTDCYNEIYKGVEKKHAIPVAMIDYGTCSIDNIGKADTTFIDAIRVIFKKEKIKDAIPFCKKIKEKGYKLFIQAISITAYSDLEMLEYIQIINEVKPFAFSIVDTYGLLDDKQLSHYFYLYDYNLDPEISIGYHAHNNFQLAFANSKKYISLETKRNIVVDGTVYGMGKSAGNCPSELIAMELNDHYGKSYDINQFLEILDNDLYPIYMQHYWGYKYNFYISALQKCHPNYVKELLDKKTLTVSSINQILSKIPDEKKLLFNKDYIEEAYLEFLKHNGSTIDDAHILEKNLCDQDIVLLGPGGSITKYENEIKKAVRTHNATLISINFSPEQFDADYIFISNAKRYEQLCDMGRSEITVSKLILTSNITPYDIKPDFVLSFSNLVDQNKSGSDNALLLCLTALKTFKVKKVMLAGFDGFSSNSSDYYDVAKAFAGNEEYKSNMNSVVSENIAKISRDLNIEFITPSLYKCENTQL